jgi:flagellin
LSAEVARIAENTQWNGTNILDGARTNSVFQIGANANQTIAVNFGDLSTNNIGIVVNTANSGAAIPAAGLDAVVIGLSAPPANGDTLSYKVTSINADGTTATNYATIDLDSYAAATADVGAGALAVETTSAGAAATEVSKSSFTFHATAPSITIAKVSTTAGDKITISDVQLTRGTHAPVAATDITSRAFSTTALNVLDTAIEGVNSTRATLGASMSRLEYAADNLQNVSQNSSAARSRVLDADYASETTELARTQIIQQASTAMLSQANQAQQSVLSLLK